MADEPAGPGEEQTPPAQWHLDPPIDSADWMPDDGAPDERPRLGHSVPITLRDPYTGEEFDMTYQGNQRPQAQAANDAAVQAQADQAAKDAGKPGPSK